MVDDKYYKVKKQTSMDGQVEFVVFGCSSFFNLLLGVWSEYTKKSTTKKEAIEHVEYLASKSVVKSKIVFRKKI